MNPLVFIENDQVFTDSLTVAEEFNKEHKHVIRDIEVQLSKLAEAGEQEWGVSNFGLTQYQHRQNKQWYTKYDMTEEAFAIVAMSYITPEAMKMKVRFIEEFKRLRQQLTVNTQVPSLEIQIKQQRAEAMLLNAKTKMYATVMKSLDNKNLSPIAVEVFGLTVLEEMTGKTIDYRPEVEKTYTATEIGIEAGVSINKVGRVANDNGLKTDEYGMTVLDKSRHSSKEVTGFRYNERGRQRLLELLKRKDVEACQTCK